MKMIYVCSAFQGKEENLKKAVEYGKQVITEGNLPIIPHVFYGATGLLNDNIINERCIGLSFGIELLMQCDELRVYTDATGTITKGMDLEIAKWMDIHGKKGLKYITHGGSDNDNN